MFWGLSIRMASLIFRSWSGHALVTVILWSSDCLGLLGVGWRTTCTQTKESSCYILVICHCQLVYLLQISIWLTFKTIKINKKRNSTEEQAQSHREDDCLPAKATAAAKERYFSQTQGQSHKRAVSGVPLPRFTIFHSNLTPPERLAERTENAAALCI